MYVFCKYCGTEVSDQARFCPDCGKRIEKVVILKDTNSTSSAESWPHHFDEQEAKPVSATPVATAESSSAEQEEFYRAKAKEAASEIDAITQDSASQPNQAPPYQNPLNPQAPPANPYYAPPANPYFYAQPRRERSGCAIASLVLGLCSVFLWLFPFLGLPATIIGLVMGILGRNSQNRGMSIAGIVLSSIFLAVTIGYIVISFLLILGSMGSGYSYYYY